MQAHSPLDSAVVDEDDANDGKRDDSSDGKPGDESGHTYVTLLHMYPTVHHIHEFTCILLNLTKVSYHTHSL